MRFQVGDLILVPQDKYSGEELVIITEVFQKQDITTFMILNFANTTPTSKNTLMKQAKDRMNHEIPKGRSCKIQR